MQYKLKNVNGKVKGLLHTGKDFCSRYSKYQTLWHWQQPNTESDKENYPRWQWYFEGEAIGEEVCRARRLNIQALIELSKNQKSNEVKAFYSDFANHIAFASTLAQKEPSHQKPTKRSGKGAKGIISTRTGNVRNSTFVYFEGDTIADNVYKISLAKDYIRTPCGSY